MSQNGYGYRFAFHITNETLTWRNEGGWGGKGGDVVGWLGVAYMSPYARNWMHAIATLNAGRAHTIARDDIRSVASDSRSHH